MKQSDLTDAATEILINVEDVQGRRALAFLPDVLPGRFTLTNEIALESEHASFALGQLKFMGRLVPNPVMFAQPFIRKEAVASTRIEGTRTDFEQLIRFEAEGSRAHQGPDSQEAENYFRALMLGWRLDVDRLASITTISELHHALMQGVRGQDRNPGRVRTTSVAIGDARDTIALGKVLELERMT